MTFLRNNTQRSRRTRLAALLGGGVLIAGYALGIAPAAAADDPVKPAPSSVGLPATLTVGDTPDSIVLNNTGTRGYVTLNKTVGEIAVVDMIARTVTGHIDIGAADPGYLAINGANDTLYVSTTDWVSGMGTRVQVIDLASGSVTGTVFIPSQAQGVTVSADDASVYVVGIDGTLSVIAADTLAVKAVIPLPGQNAHSVQVSPDGTRAYVALEGALQNTPMIVEIDLSIPAVARTLLLPDGGNEEAAGIDLTPDGTTLYVTTGYGAKIRTVDVASMSITASVSAGPGVYRVAAIPENNVVLTASLSWEYLLSVDTATNTRSNSARTVGAGAFDVAVDPTRSYAVVTDRWADTLSFLDFPAITNPAPVTVEDAEEATFSSDASNIYPSTVTLTWEVSSDEGASWAAVPDADEETLSFIAASADNGNLYRIGYHDTFTGARGYSTPALLTVGGRAAPPVITSGPLPNGVAGAEYGPFTVTASGDPVITFSAEGLPAGLRIDPTTGIISGNSTEVGIFTVRVTAVNAAGSDTATYRVELTAAAVSPAPSPSTVAPTTPGGGDGGGTGLAGTGTNAPTGLLGLAGALALLGAGLLIARRRRPLGHSA